MKRVILTGENENFVIAVAICEGLPTSISSNAVIRTFLDAHEIEIVISELSADALKNAIIYVSANLEKRSLYAINIAYLLSWEVVLDRWEQALCK
jgi:hypothetical protein